MCLSAVHFQVAIFQHSVGRNHRYQSNSVRSDYLGLNPTEYIELHPLSNIQGTTEDESLGDMDAAYKWQRRPKIRNSNRVWRSNGSTAFLTEPQVILINTSPQGDISCQSCCCACHRSRCRYIDTERYPLVSEMAQIARNSMPRNSVTKKSNKHITFDPEPEFYCEGAEMGNEVAKPVSTHISEKLPNETKEISNQQPQLVIFQILN